MAITTKRSIDAELPHDPTTARDEATRHGMSERSNDVPTIMDTISAFDQHFSLLSLAPAGELGLTLALDMDEVREFYEDRVKGASLVGGYNLKRVASPWFLLNETIGVFEDNTTHEPIHTRVAVLFPTWTDGIIGEILWEWPFGDPPADWKKEGEVARALDQLDAFMLAGDVDGALSMVEDDTCSVLRTVELGSDRRQRTIARTKEELGAAWSTRGEILEMKQTARVISYFYAFAAYRMQVKFPDRTVERQVASLYPIAPSGGIVGELSYALEVPITG